MDVFVIGITGRVGGLLARDLRERGDRVRGLVRREEQRARLEEDGLEATVGDLAALSTAELAEALAGADVVVFAAGSNGEDRETTRTIDGDGVAEAIDAAGRAGVARFALVSVLPESWRERDNGDDLEYYFAVKKQADVATVRSALDWIVLRPSLLLTDPAAGTVSLGPAELHDQIARADVAATLAAILHEPRISRQILELNAGSVPIAEAVAGNVRTPPGPAGA